MGGDKVTWDFSNSTVVFQGILKESEERSPYRLGSQLQACILAQAPLRRYIDSIRNCGSSGDSKHMDARNVAGKLVLPTTFVSK